LRIRVRMFTDDMQTLDINYNYFITSYIYHLLNEEDAEFSRLLHDEGFVYGGKHFKLFTYSGLRMLDFYDVNGPYLRFRGKVDLYISSPVVKFMQDLASSMLNMGEMRIGKAILKIEEIEALQEPRFEDGENRFLCLSPITMSTKREIDGELKPRDMNINEDGFKENLIKNLKRKYELMVQSSAEDKDLHIYFDKEYLKNHPKGKLINFKGTYIKGYLAPFIMSGDKDLMWIAYHAGLGEKNSLGFGMIEKI